MSETTAVTITTPKGDIVIKKEDVRNYLCPKATDQEIFMFLQMCKTQGLNPFTKEAYLIKYSEGQAASMVVSKDAFMKRAESHPAYDGFRAGIVIKDANGSLVEREGALLTDNEILMGGWAEVYRKDRRMSIKNVVSLREYSRNQSSWNIMKATMIRKVAIVHTMREAFPSEVGGLYIEDEMQNIHTEAKNITPAYEISESTMADIKEIAGILKYNDAKINMLLGQYKGRENELITYLKGQIQQTTNATVENSPVEENPVFDATTTSELELPLKPDTTKNKNKRTSHPLEEKRNKLIAGIKAMKDRLPEDIFNNIRKHYPDSVDKFSMRELVTLVDELTKAEEKLTPEKEQGAVA